MKYKKYGVDGTWEVGQEPTEVDVTMKEVGSTHKYVVTGIEELEGEELDSVTTIIGSADGTGTFPISRWYARLAAEYGWDTELWEQGLSGTEDRERFVQEVKNYPIRVFETAGHRGTLIHKALEIYLDPDTPPDWWKDIDNNGVRVKDKYLPIEFKLKNLESCFKDIKDWIHNGGFVIRGREIPVFHKDLRIGGTIDLLLSKEIPPEEREHYDNNKLIIMIVDFKTGSDIRWKDQLQQSAYATCIMSMMDEGIMLWDGMLNDVITKEDVGMGATLMHIQEEFGVKKIPRVVAHHVQKELINNLAISSATFLHNMSKIKTSKEKL